MSSLDENSICRDDSSVEKEDYMYLDMLPESEIMENGSGVFTFNIMDHATKLISNFNIMRREHVLTDLCLLQPGGTKYEFHALLLATVSTVFRKLLCGNALQYYAGELVPQGVSPEVLEALGTYIYQPSQVIDLQGPMSPILEFASLFGLEHMAHGSGDVIKMFSMAKHMYVNNLLTFTKVSVNQQQFLCHGSLLAASSPVFRNYFAPKVLPPLFKEIHLLHTDPGAFKVLMEYLYSAKLEINDDNAMDVLVAASNCRFIGAASACCIYIARRMTPFNVIRVLNLSRALKKQYPEDPPLLELCCSATKLAISKFHVLLTTANFREIETWKDIVTFLKETDRTKIQSGDVFDAIIQWYHHNGAHRVMDAARAIASMIALLNPPEKEALDAWDGYVRHLIDGAEEVKESA